MDAATLPASPSSRPPKRARRLVVTAATALATVLAAALAREASLSWALVRLDVRAFDNELKYSVAEVPTTYYQPGGLANITTWVERFHLYRAAFETPEVDLHAFPMHLRAWPESILKGDSALCYTRNLTESLVMNMHLRNLSSLDILKGGWYSTFAKAANDAPERLYETLGLGFPMVKVADTFVTHTFMSNLRQDKITSSLHANCFSLSMAVQFVGSKSWLFVGPEDLLGTFGAQPSIFMLPQQASSRPFVMYEYTSRPGDVLFFPANWGHAVKTHAGPQLMMNYRIPTWGSMTAQPWNFAKALFNVVFLSWKLQADSPEVKDAFHNVQREDGAVPTFIQSTSQAKLAEVCTSLGRATRADQQLVALLEAL